MRSITTLATAAVAAVALALPTAGVISSPAGAVEARTTTSAVGQQLSGAEAFQARKGKKGKIKLSTSAPGAQPGIGGVVVTAKKLKGSGKVTFKLSTGVKLGKAKVKKGKAKITLPPMVTGDYTIKAKLGKAKGSTSFRVYSSAVTLNSTSFTVSKSAYTGQQTLSGSILFKDKVATKGYVDIYRDGNKAGGTSSPGYLTMSAVDGAGNFSFGTSFASRIALETNDDGSATYVAGQTYSFQAFYTEGFAFADYIASNFITVVVTP